MNCLPPAEPCTSRLRQGRNLKINKSVEYNTNEQQKWFCFNFSLPVCLHWLYLFSDKRGVYFSGLEDWTCFRNSSRTKGSWMSLPWWAELCSMLAFWGIVPSIAKCCSDRTHVAGASRVLGCRDQCQEAAVRGRCRETTAGKVTFLQVLHFIYKAEERAGNDSSIFGSKHTMLLWPIWPKHLWRMLKSSCEETCYSVQQHSASMFV